MRGTPPGSFRGSTQVIVHDFVTSPEGFASDSALAGQTAEKIADQLKIRFKEEGYIQIEKAARNHLFERKSDRLCPWPGTPQQCDGR